MAGPITVAGFAGAALAPNPRLLVANVGVSVIDAEPGDGELRPLRDRLTVATVPANPQRLTIYRMGRDQPNDSQFWLSWSTYVNVMRSFNSDDTTEMTFYTGDGTPKWTDNVKALGGGPPYPQAARELAVPAPINAPLVTITTDGTTGDEGQRFYVTTFVNDIGWESAPSPPSAALTVKPGAVLAITGLEAAPAGNYGFGSPGGKRRIYRTQAGTTDAAASFYFLREIDISVTSTTDDNRDLGDVIATIGMIPPPGDAHGLIGLWNGMAAFISGKTISFTEPYEPYAAPVKYDIEVLDTPVALAKWEQNLLVLTTGRTVLLQGQNPASMSESGSFAGHPCAAARGVVEFSHGVVWPSNEGLAYSGSLDVLTLGIFKPAQWRSLIPSSFVASRYGRFYVASYIDTSGIRKGLMIDPLAPQNGVWFLSTGFDAAWYDPLADALYVLEGGNVRKFDAATTLLTASFKSKVFHQVGPRAFAWGKVVADAYPVTANIYADGALRFSKTVTGQAPFTLPSGFVAEDWQVEVITPCPVQAAHLATSVYDFRMMQ